MLPFAFVVVVVFKINCIVIDQATYQSAIKIINSCNIKEMFTL